jgi:hypothetical protein
LKTYFPSKGIPKESLKQWTYNTHTIVNWKKSAKCYWRLWNITNMTSLTSYEDPPVWNVKLRRYLASCTLLFQ